MPPTSLATEPFASWLGLDDVLIQSVLSEATSRGADFADLYFEHSRSTSISLEDGIISSAATSVDQGVGIRVVVGEQTGYAYSESLTLDAMRQAARTAAAIATGSTPKVKPQAIGLKSHPDYYETGPIWERVAVEEKLPLLSKVETLCKQLDPAVQKVSVSWVDGDERVLIATSEGAVYSDRRPMAGLRLGVTAVKDGERQTNHGSLYRRAGIEHFTDERLTKLCKETVERTMVLFESRMPPAGEMPVILAAGASGILLHEAIGHGLEADFNRKGISIYADMIGRKVAPEFVTVVDDGTIDEERGAVNVDDEGSPTERTTLIENGVLKSFMHDKISAKQYGVAPTGSGRRESFRHTPMPRMRCTFMEDGPHTYDEIVAAVDHGIVAETFLNGQVQIGAGDFTFFVKNGWLIENGKITAPIRNVNIIGNGPEALRDIVMAADDAKLDTGGWTCGKEGQGVPVSQGQPSVLVKKLVVGGEDRA
ncbi:MAG: metallopeptidase TldD-related protein [Planctomycetota bacterium]|nr:metallopeptidase TldD-related protein [Planctomycetota bacterium]